MVQLVRRCPPALLGLVALENWPRPTPRSETRVLPVVRQRCWRWWRFRPPPFWSLDGALALHDVRVKLPLAVGGLVLLAARGSAPCRPAPWTGSFVAAAFGAVAATATIVVLDLVEGAPFGGQGALPVHLASIRALVGGVAPAGLNVPALEGVVTVDGGLRLLAWFWTES